MSIYALQKGQNSGDIIRSALQCASYRLSLNAPRKVVAVKKPTLIEITVSQLTHR